MEHIAIDLGGTESQICVRSADGSIVEEVRWGTRQLATYLKRRPPGRVILETSSEAFKVADAARRPDTRFVSSPRRWFRLSVLELGASKPIAAMLRCSARFLHASLSLRFTFLPTSSRSRCTFAKAVRRAALATPERLPDFIEHQLAVIELLNDRVALADAELKALASQLASA